VTPEDVKKEDIRRMKSIISTPEGRSTLGPALCEKLREEIAQHTIDEIFAVRVRNNIPWKRLMEIALKHAPEEAREALRQINENDRAISDLLGELVK